MKRSAAPFLAVALCLPALAATGNDAREPVALPEPMRAHLLANMREHLETLDSLLALLAEGQGDRAAELAESRLGMSSLERHGASHMAPYMPEGMRKLGTQMHQAASRFARVAQEGDALRAYGALREVTRTCVACHAGYRIR